MKSLWGPRCLLRVVRGSEINSLRTAALYHVTPQGCGDVVVGDRPKSSQVQDKGNLEVGSWVPRLVLFTHQSRKLRYFPADSSLCQQGTLWSELKSMFSQPGMPLPFDAPLSLCVQLPRLPSPCQLVGTQAMGVGRVTRAAGQPSPFVPGTALPRTQRAE